MSLIGKYILSLHTLEKFVNDALHLMHHSGHLNGFYYNKYLLKAACMNTYVETISNKAGSLHLEIESTWIRDIMDSMFSMIMAITRPFNFSDKKIILAFDYTYWDFYGKSSNLWIRDGQEKME